MKGIVYIAGPYGAGTAFGRARNVLRAQTLAAYAFRSELAPVVIHALIDLGLLGLDDRKPEERLAGPTIAKAAAAKVAALSVEQIDHNVGFVARGVGHLWVILRDDRTPSSGSTEELVAYMGATYGAVEVPVMKTWNEWLAQIGKEFPAIAEAYTEQHRLLVEADAEAAEAR